jgi:hypothetical protein
MMDSSAVFDNNDGKSSRVYALKLPCKRTMMNKLAVFINQKEDGGNIEFLCGKDSKFFFYCTDLIL